MTEVEVAPLARGRAAEAASLLAASLLDGAAFAHLVPDRPRRARAMRALMRVLLTDALPFGAVDAAMRGPALLGVAVWLPPHAGHAGLRRRLRMAPGLLALLAAAPREAAALAAYGATLDGMRPAAPHWYLAALGVAPGAQGSGTGTALLRSRPVSPAYLETTSERARALYERFGFDVQRGELRVLTGGPPHWTMLRP